MRSLRLLICLVLILASPPRAKAEGDGLYGQLDKAFTLGISAGGGMSAGAMDDAVSPVIGAQLDLFFLSALGFKAAYSYGRKDLTPQLRLTNHSLAFSFEFRFLFPLIFLNNLYSGYSTLDLIMYSLGFEIGGSYERANFAGAAPLPGLSGFGFHLGLGFEIPLARRGGRGWYLRIHFQANFLPPTRLPNHGELDLDNFQLMAMVKYRFQFMKDL